MRKNKLHLFLLLLVTTFFRIDVFAIENINYSAIYINANGITLTEKEYQFVNQFYGEDYFDKMTQEQYDWILDLDINNRNVSISKIYDAGIFNSSIPNRDNPYHSTNSKSLSIAKSCGNSSCTIITNLTWLINPTIRSYDVIGTRLYNTNLINNTITTKVSSSAGTTYSSNNKFITNGFGTSVKLPDNATNIYVEQKFYTQKNGTVYASYQHATSNVTLATSLQFTIGGTGSGGVFVFYGNAIGKYDGMAGVNIDL